MSYIPANPHFAIVNCKIGDLNLTPIPPDTLESFTYERDTDSGIGNKFSITVHDETAIVMESYLAETAFKMMNAESYDFGDVDQLTNIYAESTDINKKEVSESSSNSEEQNNEASAMSISAYDLSDEIPAFYQSTLSSSKSTVDNELTLRRDNSNQTTLKNRRITENTTAFSSVDGDTNIISGGVGKNVTTNTSPIYTNTGKVVIPLKIDNSKLIYADPSTGISELGGYPIENNVWMSEKAIAEFSDGSDPNDPEL